MSPSSESACPPTCARVSIRLSLHWDARVKGLALHAKTPITSSSDQPPATNTKMRQHQRQQQQQMVRVAPVEDASAAGARGTSLLLPLVVDDSVSLGGGVLPLAYAQMVGWRAGQMVQVEAVQWQEEVKAAVAAGEPTGKARRLPPPRRPIAYRVRAQVWQPGVGVVVARQPQQQQSHHATTPLPAAASSGRSVPFRSAPLADALHEALLAQPFVCTDDAHTAAAAAGTTGGAGPSSTDFRILHWQGLVCLMRIVQVTTLVTKVQAPAQPGAAQDDDPAEGEEDEEDEVDVRFALVDEDTEVECDVMTQAPMVVGPAPMPGATAAEQAVAGVSTPVPPLFSRMASVASSSASAAASSSSPVEDVSVGGCFPREWHALQQFVWNAIQSRSATSATATAASNGLAGGGPTTTRTTTDFDWGIPRAMLVTGSSGAGKSKLLDAFVASLPPHRFVVQRVSGAALVGGAAPAEDDVLFQQYETLRRELLAIESDGPGQALVPLPTHAGVLVLEDLDAIICHRAHPRQSTQLLSLLERLQSSSSSSFSSSPSASASSPLPPAHQSPPPLILLIGSVRAFSRVPSHFLSTGRFEAHCEFGLLTRDQRRRLLKQMIGRVEDKVKLDATGALTQQDEQQQEEEEGAGASFAPPAAAAAVALSHPTSPPGSVKPLDLLCTALADRTPGYLASDLAKLVQHAWLHAGLRWDAQGDAAATAADATIIWADLAAGLRRTHPSNGSTPSATLQLAPGEAPSAAGSTDTPAVATAAASDSFPSVGGYPTLKKRLSLTLFHWLHPERIQTLGLRPISGVLFVGPSGVGKSLFATALARQAGLNFVAVSVASVFSAYFGESERKIRALFAQAAQLAPCVLLLDHVDALAGKRDGEVDGAQGVDARVLSTLLNEMDGIEKRPGVYVVGCTQHPSKLDSALMRPGRFDDIIEVDLPNEDDRQAILRLTTRRVRLADDVDLQRVSQQTEGMTGADLQELVSKAGMQALRADPEHARCVSQRNFEDALKELTADGAQ